MGAAMVAGPPDPVGIVKSHAVVEWAPFRLAPGESGDQLSASSRDLRDTFLAKQSGFLRRELPRGGNGDRVDLVHRTDHVLPSSPRLSEPRSTITPRPLPWSGEKVEHGRIERLSVLPVRHVSGGGDHDRPGSWQEASKFIVDTLVDRDRPLAADDENRHL